MKYKLVKKAETAEEIDSILLNVLTHQEIFCCDSVLETDDRIIVRYLRKVLSKENGYIDDSILYIHYSKKAEIFTKICCYVLEEPTE